MYRKILVPLDGSDFSESALPPALSIAERTQGELHLVTVISTLPPVMMKEDGEGSATGWFEEEGLRGRQYLEDLATRLGQATSIPIHTRVLSGNPVHAITERVVEIGADQIVMTTHGRRPIQRLWLGSVADGLVRAQPVPILLWRPADGEVDLESRPGLGKIILPLDGSEVAEAMTPWVEALAKLFGATITLIHIHTPAQPFGSPYLPHAAAEESARASELEEMRAYLAGVAERLRSGGAEVDAQVLSGTEPAQGILEYQKSAGADLVALSTRGRGGVTRMVLGSVADKVIRGTEAHVLVHLASSEE